jgi:hypothetical protein
MRGLPREAVIEDQHLMASALPFSQQPGPGLQLRAGAHRDPPGLLQLQGDLVELALQLRSQPA